MTAQVIIIVGFNYRKKGPDKMKVFSAVVIKGILKKNTKSDFQFR